MIHSFKYIYIFYFLAFFNTLFKKSVGIVFLNYGKVRYNFEIVNKHYNHRLIKKEQKKNKMETSLTTNDIQKFGVCKKTLTLKL